MESNHPPLSYQESVLPLNQSPEYLQFYHKPLNKEVEYLYNVDMQNLTTLLLKLPRNTEVTPEAAQTFLASLVQVNSISFFEKLTGVKPRPLALELALINQQIRFQVTCDSSLVPFVETQIQSNYPLVIIQKTPDVLPVAPLEVVNLKLKQGSYYPLATFDKFKDVDPLSSVLAILAQSTPDEIALVQIALQSTSPSWQGTGASYAEKGTKNEDGSYSPRSDKTIITEKISYPGFKASIRLASNTKQTLSELKNAFGVFTRADGNSFSTSKSNFLNKNSVYKNLMERKVTSNQVLNIMELATVWHLPSEKIKTPTIAWGTSVLSEPPDNLPTALMATDEQKAEINFFAKTLFKNKEAIFGIKEVDRRRHVWTIGKTGTGKSTLIANMAIDDLKKGRGLAVIDPHGDLSDTLLNYIPKSRINDVIYFNPADKDFPIVINPLEVKNKEEAELVVSGLMSIFTKIWVNVWSARMEYILRNSLLTLSQVENTTLGEVITLLTDRAFRKKIVDSIDDPALKRYWTDEYERMPEKFQQEAISAILNKVGQFVTSPLVRSIIGKPKSTIAIDEIMNEGKILIVNLSQGRLGEDNAALLGAMIITKVQLAAMHRVDVPEAERRDFYLYVDEFQNFATTSFIKILSEARKYRLSVTLANQYVAQIPEDVQRAILGNAGTIIAFSVGASDAGILFKEFAEVFSENDLVNLSNFQIATKMTIDGHSARPFLANTLPLPISVNQNKDKVIKVSRERWSKKINP